MGAWWFNYHGQLQITKFELACLSGWMYTVFLVCPLCLLICLACSLFALPCLHYLRFEPSQLGCLGSSVDRALDKWPSGHGLKSCPRQLSVFFHCLPLDSALPCLAFLCIYMVRYLKTLRSTKMQKVLGGVCPHTSLQNEQVVHFIIRCGLL